MAEPITNPRAVRSAENFYRDVLTLLAKHNLPVMLGGTYAVSHYTGIKRPTKDLDLHCKTGDYVRILTLLNQNGYETEITDAQWLAKVRKGKYFIDFIYNTVNNVCAVDDSWLLHAPAISFLEHKVKIVAPEELIWIKSYMQGRRRSEVPDVHHLLLKTGKMLDWKRLANRMETHWEILLNHLILFRFVYPSEREIVPKWLLEDLFSRATQELALPIPKERICRGPLLSRLDYKIDVTEWGYKTTLED